MSYSINTARAELEGMLHGTTLDKVKNVNGCFNRAARQLLLDIDPHETKRITQTGLIYDRIYDYDIPADLKGDGVIDIRPQQERQLYDKFQGKYNQSFDLRKDRYGQSSFTIQYDDGVKTIRMADRTATAGTQLNTCDSLTGNGTWAVSGDASNLTIDNTDYIENSGSLKFNLASSGSQGIITNTGMTAIDLTEHENQSAIFFYVYLQTASVFTSIEIRWGSDASNYWSRSLTTTHQGNPFANGWNEMRADWNGATETGSPDVENIDYIQVLYNYDGTEQTGIKLDNISSKLGKIYEIEYYSKYLFRNSSTGVFQETVLSNDDLINLDTETYNVFLWQVVLQMVQQQFGKDSGFDLNEYKEKYYLALKRYKALYKGEKSKPRSTYYYTTRNREYRNYGL